MSTSDFASINRSQIFIVTLADKRDGVAGQVARKRSKASPLHAAGLFRAGEPTWTCRA